MHLFCLAKSFSRSNVVTVIERATYQYQKLSAVDSAAGCANTASVQSRLLGLLHHGKQGEHMTEN